jgi:hypothetical protein
VAKYVLFVFPKWKILYLLFGGTNNVSVFKNIMVVEKWPCLAWCDTTDDYAIIEFLMFGVYNLFSGTRNMDIYELFISFEYLKNNIYIYIYILNNKIINIIYVIVFHIKVKLRYLVILRKKI